MEPIVYIDRSEIRAGRLQDVKRAIPRLVAFLEANEPQLISYGIYLDEDESTMSVVAVHPDSASMEFHLEIGGPEFRKFAELIDLRAIDVYGHLATRFGSSCNRRRRCSGRTDMSSCTRLYQGFRDFLLPVPKTP